MNLAMELMVLHRSHQKICDFLGPYDNRDEGDEDYVADYYRDYYEERISFILLSLSVLIRTLDDRNLLSDNINKKEPQNIGLGNIKKWEMDTYRQF
jgi:hypothetical protein